MCVVSFVGDNFRDRWPNQFPWLPQTTITAWPPVTVPSQEEFDKLKREVEIMKELLKGAKAYDEKNKEPNCKMDEKVAFIKDVAKFVGVDLEEIFANNQGQTPPRNEVC